MTDTFAAGLRRAGVGLILAAAVVSPAGAQGDDPHSGDSTLPWARGGVRLVGGVTHHAQTDLMASPLRYRGTAPGGGVAYRRAGDRTRFEVAGAFSALGLESAISGGGSREDVWVASLRTRWLHRVAKGRRWEGFVGARLDLLLPVRRHTYPPQGLTELYGDLFVPLMAVAAHELRLTPRMVAWQALAAPVAALVLRSPYTGLKYSPDPELAPPGRLLGLDHVIGVDRAMGPHWSWVAEWRLGVLRYPDPRELTLVTHRWTLGLEVRL